MNSLGLRTTRNNPLQVTTIDKIVTNEKYIGVYEYQKAGIRKEDAFPAIVTKEVFYQAQERKKAQQKGYYTKRNYGGSAKRIYPLSGLVYCGECGSTMFGETVYKNRGKKNEYSNSYYTCRCRRKGKDGLKCAKKPVPALALEQIVRESLYEIFVDESAVNTIVNTVNEVKKEESTSHKMKTLRLERRKKQQAIQNNLKALDAGECQSIILAHLKTLEKDLVFIDREIDHYQTIGDNVARRLGWLLTQYQVFPENSDEYWNDVFHCFINSVTCYENGDILIQINLLSPTPTTRFLRRFEAKANLNEHLRKVRRERAMSKSRANAPPLHNSND